jgi:hypothetical protein
MVSLGLRTLAGLIAGPSGGGLRGVRVNVLYSAGDIASHAVRNLASDHRTLIGPFVFFLLSLGVLALLWSGARGRVARGALLAVTAADLYCVHAYIYFYPDTRPAFHAEEREEIAILKKQGYDPNRERVYPLEPEILYTYPLLNMLSRVSVINDYTPMWLKRYQAFAGFYPNGAQPPDRVTDVKLLAVTSARYLLTRSPEMRRRLAAARTSVTGSRAAETRTPSISQWTLGEARASADGLSLQASSRDAISLMQTAVALQPGTTYLVRFEARADSPLDRPLVVDFYGGAGYDNADQDRVLAELSPTFRPQSLLIDAGPNPPAEALLRMFTQSTVPIHVRGISISTLDSSAASPFQELATTKDGITVFVNQAGLPRFRFARRLLPVKDVGEAQALFQSPEFDAANSVTVEGLTGPQTVQPGQIVSQTIENTRMQWRLRTPEKSFLVVADSWFPGWTATVDGRAAQIYPVDGFLRGVFVEGAGEHDVEMVFRPMNLYVGLVCTMFGIAVLCLLYLGRLPGRLRSARTSLESGPG